jgi:hypothetical protein
MRTNYLDTIKLAIVFGASVIGWIYFLAYNHIYLRKLLSTIVEIYRDDVGLLV